MDPELSQGLFAWASREGGLSGNLWVGGLFFVVGLVGSLVAGYFFLGGFLPAMGGKVRYELREQEIATKTKQRDAALRSREAFARGEKSMSRDEVRSEETLSRDLTRLIDCLESGQSRERWRLIAIGFPIYVVLGGLFATAFAENLTQAAFIGFGWPVIADRIGLRDEGAVRRSVRDEQIEQLEREALKSAGAASRLQQLSAENQALRDQIGVMARRIQGRASDERGADGRATDTTTDDAKRSDGSSGTDE